jgi:hypothetical protein
MKRLAVFACVAWMAACTKAPQNATNPDSKSGLTQSSPSGETPVAGTPSANSPAPKSAAAPAPAAVAPAPEIVLPAGTAVKIITTSSLSTENVKAGQSFEGSLHAPITVNEKVVLPKGTPVRGVIAESDPGGRVKGRARLALRLTSFDVDGKKVTIATNTFVREAPGTKKRDAMKIGIGSGAGAAIGAIAGGGAGAAIGAAAGAGAGTGVVLATRGEPARIPSESVVAFRLREAVKF